MFVAPHENYWKMPPKRKRNGYKSLTSAQYAAKRATATRLRSYLGQPGYAPRSGYVHNIAPETKYFDCGIQAAVTWAATSWADSEVPCDNFVSSSGTSSAYTDSALIPSAIGSGYGQVNGNRYYLKRFRIRGNIEADVAVDQADTLPPITVRLLLVMDTQPNGLQAQGEDVLQDVGAGETIHSFQRVSATSGRFRVLKDETHILQPCVTTTDGASTGAQMWEGIKFNWMYQPTKPRQVNVKSGSATPTVASLVDTNIFMLLAANRSSAAVLIRINACSRCYYSD